MKFGQLTFTKGIARGIDKDIEFSKFIVSSLERYGMNDWGDLCKEDVEMNDLAVKHNEGRVVARYNHLNRDIYIITEMYGMERITTVLFCDEY